ncbi:GTP-binding protein [Anaeroselena agilis]|uniref:GTP-binding protein n=1 Tax=Anaeroselena agilis TaxID=3063788 RepID=A0ABU3P0L1_9FIRM|nr:GTP-binding protein [Selenomonadales bacterium 4137-cl]
MRILLFGGFLGSGKTSIILQLARQITAAGGETVAIIENEIGEEGVDDKLLAASGLTVKPLFGGCVCCQITGDLVAAVKEIAETLNPDWLIIEMTGLAIPGNVARLIRQYNTSGSKCKTITVVDAGRWAELKQVLEPLLLSQVQDSDLIIVNKTDIAGPEVNNTVEDVRASVGKVTILTASAVKILPPALFKEVINLE